MLVLFCCRFLVYILEKGGGGGAGGGKFDNVRSHSKSHEILHEITEIPILADYQLKNLGLSRICGKAQIELKHSLFFLSCATFVRTSFHALEISDRSGPQ